MTVVEPVQKKPSSRFKRLIIFAVVVLLALPGLSFLLQHPDPSVAVLPDDGEMHDSYENYLEQFPADYGALIVVASKQCDQQTWQLLDELHYELASLPVVADVVSVVTAELVSGVADTVEVNKFSDIEAVADRCKAMASYQPIQNLLVNDGSVFAIHVTANHPVTAAEFSEPVRSLVEAKKLAYTNAGGIFLTGEMVMSHELMLLTNEDSGLLLISLVLMFVLVGVYARSFVIGLVTVFSGLFSVIFTVSLMGYVAVPISPVNSLMINMLIPLGAAFTIHALNYDMRQTIFPKLAWVPFLFATITTMLGFGLTCMSTSPAIQAMGILGGIGIGFSLFIVMYFTFPILHLIGHTPKAHSVYSAVGMRMSKLQLFPKWVTGAVSALVLTVTVWGVSALQVDYGPVDYFVDGHPVKQDYMDAGKWFGRYAVPLLVTADDQNLALETSTWRMLDNLIGELKKDYPGLEAAWLGDQISTMHKAFNAELKGVENIYPANSALNAQYLLMFSADDIAHNLNDDRSQAVLMLQLPFASAKTYLEMKEKIRSFSELNEIDIQLTGRLNSFFETGQDIAFDNLSSLGWGILILLVVFGFYLRSIKTAMVVVLVNALPVLVCLGMMGIFNISLDLGSSIVATIALGLVLDDTGHLIAKYRYYRLKGSSADFAAQRMVEELSTPVILTTVTIVVGFSVMNFAQMTPFHTFSTLLASALVTACFADLVLLPQLLIWIDRDKNQGIGNSASSNLRIEDSADTATETDKKTKDEVKKHEKSSVYQADLATQLDK